MVTRPPSAPFWRRSEVGVERIGAVVLAMQRKKQSPQYPPRAEPPLFSVQVRSRRIEADRRLSRFTSRPTHLTRRGFPRGLHRDRLHAPNVVQSRVSQRRCVSSRLQALPSRLDSAKSPARRRSKPACLSTSTKEIVPFAPRARATMRRAVVSTSSIRLAVILSPSSRHSASYHPRALLISNVAMA